MKIYKKKKESDNYTNNIIPLRTYNKQESNNLTRAKSSIGNNTLDTKTIKRQKSNNKSCLQNKKNKINRDIKRIKIKERINNQEESPRYSNKINIIKKKNCDEYFDKKENENILRKLKKAKEILEKKRKRSSS